MLNTELIGMRQLDKRLDRRLRWLLAPLCIVAVFSFTDLLFDLQIGTLNWIDQALMICYLIPFIGYLIAYYRHKCWELFIITIVMLIIGLLGMSDFFLKLILGDSYWDY